MTSTLACLESFNTSCPAETGTSMIDDLVIRAGKENLPTARPAEVRPTLMNPRLLALCAVSMSSAL